MVAALRTGNATILAEQGTTPWGEATPDFEIDILAADGVTVVRTLTSAVETATYTQAQWTADFGTLPAPLAFRVAKLSAVVGRG